MHAFANSRPLDRSPTVMNAENRQFLPCVREGRPRQLGCRGFALFGYRACFGGRRRQPFEVTFEIGTIDLGEIAPFERIGPSFDFGAEGFELDSVSYRHGRRRRRGIFASNSLPGRGGLPLPARLST